MSATTRTCEAMMCDKPSGDGIICRDCLKILERVLAEVPWLLRELDIAEAKESKFSPSGDKVTTIGGSLPMPIDLSAVDARRDLADKLALWASDLSRSGAVTALAAHTPTNASAWLLRHIERIRTFDAAGDLHEELCASRAGAKYVIDRPAERRYLGECGATFADEDGEMGPPCTETLWGRQGDTFAYCKTCGAEWLMEPRLERIADQAMSGLEDRIMTARQAAETLLAIGIANDKSAVHLRDRIRFWAKVPSDPTKQALLTSPYDIRGLSEKLEPGYRFRDVTELVRRFNDKAKTRRSA